MSARRCVCSRAPFSQVPLCSSLTVTDSRTGCSTGVINMNWLKAADSWATLLFEVTAPCARLSASLTCWPRGLPEGHDWTLLAARTATAQAKETLAKPSKHPWCSSDRVLRKMSRMEQNSICGRGLHTVSCLVRSLKGFIALEGLERHRCLYSARNRTASTTDGEQSVNLTLTPARSNSKHVWQRDAKAFKWATLKMNALCGHFINYSH